MVPELVRLSPGNLVVMDMDELLDEHGRLLGISIASPMAAPIWPAYNAVWLRITELIRRSGIPVLLLSPLLPAELPEGRWLHLDCATRYGEAAGRARLAGGQIEEALADAAEIRKHVPRVGPGRRVTGAVGQEHPRLDPGRAVRQDAEPVGAAAELTFDLVQG